MKQVAIYLRVSTENTKNGHTQDTAMQRLDIENYLKTKDITGFQIYEDKGFSVTKKDRPALKKLMQDCRNGKISTVVCWKMDRLFRSLKNLMDTLAEFQTLQIEFVALKDGIDLSTATGRLMMQIIGAFAEFEAAVIKERVVSGLANARSKGIRLGRPLKPGHSVVGKLKGEGKSVKEIAEFTGLSKKTVYNILNKGVENGQ
jgi:DNA invertase Pin-like site-specific DNA recombinase